MSEAKDGDSGVIQQPASTASPSIDIEKLAEKVYQLMRAEARQERIRSNGRRTRR